MSRLSSLETKSETRVTWIQDAEGGAAGPDPGEENEQEAAVTEDDVLLHVPQHDTDALFKI